MAHICQHCNRSFATPYTLLNHQNTAKFCLKIQGKVEIEFKIEEDLTCEMCDKVLANKQSFNNHQAICFTKNKKLIIQKIIDLKKENHKEREKFNMLLKEKDIQIKTLIKEKDNQLKEKDMQYKSLITEKDKHIKDLEDRLERITNKLIEQPTNVSYNNSTNLNLAVFNVTPENTQQILKDKMKREHLYYGMGGFADFAKEHLLTLENGEMIYKCFDVSRQIFKYVDNHGALIKDVKAKKLMSIIREPVIRRILEIINEYNIEYETLNKEIYDMQTDTSALRNKISKIDYFKKEALKLKSDINMMEETNKFALELSTRLSE
jgi:hypothetical protein